MMVQFLNPQFRMLLLDVNESKRALSKCLKVPRIGLGNPAELESV
jgi:hypothetical protein